MVKTSYLRSPSGILTLLSAVVGIIVLGLCLAGWPRESIRNNTSDEATIFLIKFYFFLSISVGALLLPVLVVILALTGCKGSETLQNNRGDSLMRIFWGVLILVVAAVLLQDIVQNHNDAIKSCENVYIGTNGISLLKTPGADVFSQHYGVKSVEDDLNDIAKCSKYLANGLDYKGYCSCAAKTLFKFNMNVAAGAVAVVNSLLFMAAGAVFFVTKH